MIFLFNYTPNINIILSAPKKYALKRSKISEGTKLWKPIEFNINCSQVIHNDREYINQIKNKRYIVTEELKNFSMTCEDIRKRGFYPSESLSEMELNNPIAYARNVYKDYVLLELQFLLSYAPQNHYCFSIDAKSYDLYIKLKQLSKCFNNVYIPLKKFNMTGGGIYQSLSTFECMNILKYKKWKYLFVLQNDDFPIKSNREIVEILVAKNYSLDMEFCDPSPFIDNRIDHTKKWNYKSLEFFNETNLSEEKKKFLNNDIQFQKGSYASGMPRESVDYILNKINITKYLNQINTVSKYGEDEMVWQTLFADDLLNIPHHVDKNCLSTYYNETIFTIRHAIWSGSPCKSNLWHHSVCVYGIEMLDEINNIKSLFGYRFKIDMDFGAALCYTEYLFNKTYHDGFKGKDLAFYRNSLQTIYQNSKGIDKDGIIMECRLNKRW
uniref:Glycosyltransferase family 92 protein n=1 Tax=Parastrongyloides trichosuri TaxID=131310 RepID=A0A0N4Z577_PARTI